MIYRVLFEYSEQGSKLFGINFYQLLLVLASDFNINFADEKSEQLKTFLLDKFD